MARMVQITVAGGHKSRELAALYSWVRNDRELQGCVSQQTRRPGPEDLGGSLEAVTAVLSSSAAAMALTDRLVAWIRSRRSIIELTITNSDGHKVEIDTRDPDTAASIVEKLLNQSDDA